MADVVNKNVHLQQQSSGDNPYLPAASVTFRLLFALRVI